MTNAFLHQPRLVNYQISPFLMPPIPSMDVGMCQIWCRLQSVQTEKLCANLSQKRSLSVTFLREICTQLFCLNALKPASKLAHPYINTCTKVKTY